MQTEEIIKKLEPWLAKHRRPAWRLVIEEDDGPATASKFCGTAWTGPDDVRRGQQDQHEPVPAEPLPGQSEAATAQTTPAATPVACRLRIPRSRTVEHRTRVLGSPIASLISDRVASSWKGRTTGDILIVTKDEPPSGSPPMNHCDGPPRPGEPP